MAYLTMMANRLLELYRVLKPTGSLYLHCDPTASHYLKIVLQWWAVSLVDAQPFQGRKKSADGGVDGIKFFRDLDRKEVHKIIVSVKGGALKADDVRALNHVREREGAEIALFIALEHPTQGMIKDAAFRRFLHHGQQAESCPRSVAHN